METQPATGGSAAPTNEASGSTDATVTTEPKVDQVAYETHRKLLAEKKNFQAKYEELVAANNARDEQAMAEQGQFKQLFEQERSRVAEVEAQLNSFQEERTNASKLNSFLGAVGGQVDQKYWGLIDLDSVLVNPETGNVDDMSVTNAVKSFRDEHSILIKDTNAKPMGGQAPQGANPSAYETMTQEQKLAYAAEVMRKGRL